MTETHSAEERRREPRYEISNHQRVAVHIHRLSSDGEETMEGELLDLSRGGAKISLNTCVQFAEVMKLRIVIGQLDMDMEVTAEVCWIRPTRGNRWLVGFSFCPKVADHLIEHMAKGGIIERRRHRRQPVHIAGTARWELDGEEFPVVVMDYAAGGFCMACGSPGTVGQGVLVNLVVGDQTYSVSGRVRWQLTRDDTHYVGCSVSDANDFRRLRQSAKAADKLQRMTTGPEARTSRALVYAASAMLALASGTLVGLNMPSSWRNVFPNAASSQRNEEPAPTFRQPPTDPIRNVSRKQSERVKIESRAYRGTAKTDENLQSPELPAEDSRPYAAAHRAGMTDSAPLDAIERQPVRHDSNAEDSSNTAAADTDGSWDAASPSSGDAVSGNGAFDSGVAHYSRIPHEPPIDRDLTSGRVHVPGNPPASPERDDQVHTPLLPASGESLKRARGAFVQGSQLFRTGEYARAIEAFHTAIQNDPANALYYYLLAMAQYQQGDYRQAERTVKYATVMEQQRPIENWGNLLSRFQGHPRLWLEQRRSQARTRVD